MELSFLGGTGCVTGSRYLLTVGRRRILVDCGLFQGERIYRRRNWEPFPTPPRDIDAVVLTHAHLDHSGYLPVLIRDGYPGRVFSTAATRALCSVLLRDSAHLQEEDADWATRKGFSKHHPARPLYTRRDADAALERFTPVEWHASHYLGDGIAVRFAPAGHILGAATVTFDTPEGRIAFSGDVGRMTDAVMPPPERIAATDWLVVESTYGDRAHAPVDVEDALGELVRRVAARGGVLLVPAFAVGRAQALLFLLHKLKQRGAIPNVPVFLNSPMASNVTEIFCEHRSEHRLSPEDCHATCSVAHVVRDVAESKALNERKGPMIIVSASGMLSGGRILHHLAAFGPDGHNAILLVGYQAAGTRGADLLRGAHALRIHGKTVGIKAEVANIDGMSAHADANELLSWLRQMEAPPKQTFVTHGEPSSSAALAERITRELGWHSSVPKWREIVTLSGGDLRSIAAPSAPQEAPRHVSCDGCLEG